MRERERGIPRHSIFEQPTSHQVTGFVFKAEWCTALRNSRYASGLAVSMRFSTSRSCDDNERPSHA
jgi:hypothetical protein